MILSDYQNLVKTGKISNIEEQKRIFLNLSNEIVKYLYDRVKNDGYCPNKEIAFAELINSINDNI